MSREDAVETLAAITSVPLTSHVHLPLLPLALQVAVETGRTVYDSLYISLAVHQDCVMVTADERLYNAVRGTEYEARVLRVTDEF